jgi:glycosyltransferase involved in cell wall biosynthesis
VGRITAALLEELARLALEDRFILFVRRPTDFPWPANVAERVIGPDRGYIRWQNGPLRRALKSWRPDVLLAPNYTLPLFYHRPTVLFEHDISFVSHPQWYSRRDRVKARWLVPRSLKRAPAVITESEFTKQEILKHFPFVSADKVRVVYPGIAATFRRASYEEITGWKGRKGLSGKKVVGFLGSIFNRRHIPELMEAVQMLRRKDPTVHLHLVGQDRTHPPQGIAEKIEGDGILWEQGLEDGEVSLFYSACDAFVYLSDYEGFGLPPLEALACGTVPLVLNRTSLAEVYTGMAVMLDRPDPRDVCAALDETFTDESLRRRILAGFEQRRGQFSWSNAGQAVRRIIRLVVGASRL